VKDEAVIAGVQVEGLLEADVHEEASVEHFVGSLEQ
jgi:hypothetical protein